MCAQVEGFNTTSDMTLIKHESKYYATNFDVVMSLLLGRNLVCLPGVVLVLSISLHDCSIENLFFAVYIGYVLL